MVTVFLLWEERSAWQNLMVLELLVTCKTVASFKFGATLKGFSGVESAVTVAASLIFVGKLTSG